MQALISPNELVSNGIRIAEVALQDFPVTEPLYWVDCPDDCDASTWYFNTETQQCESIPVPVPTAEQNKETAVSLLQATDWTQIASVNDPALSNPYLSNKTGFDIYRNAIRQYALNPVEGNIDWPVAPQEVWKSV